MLKLKTKTEFAVPIERGVTNAIVRLIIDKLEIDANNYIAKGYYYYFDEDGAFHQLDKIETLRLVTDIVAFQPSLPLLGSDVDHVANTIQRLREFVIAKFQSEPLENYGTIHTDWEDDNN